MINASPLAMGLLTHGGPPVWHPIQDEHKKIVLDAAKYCQEQGVNLPKIAVEFTLSQNGIPMTLLGMAKLVYGLKYMLSLFIRFKWKL